MKYLYVFFIVNFACLFCANNSLTASGTIYGYVWEDENVNGRFDESESTFANVPVFLFTCTGQYVNAILTDAGGFFQFENVDNDTYRLFVNTTGIVGPYSFTIVSDDTYNQILDSGFSECIEINDGDIDVGAGLAVLGVIGDKVWEDMNGNGWQDVGEPGIANVTVELFESGTHLLIGTTVTNALGVYIFQNILPGTYYIKVTAGNEYVKTIYQTFDQSVNSDINDSNGSFTSSSFNLSPTVHNFDIDAGLYRCIKFCGTIYDDLNISDTLDTYENGINGLVVNLWKVNGGDTILYQSTLTAHHPAYSSADGYYQFCVPPGNYFVEIEESSLSDLMPGIPFANTITSNYNHFYPSSSKLITDKFTALSGDSYCDLNNGFFCPGKVSSLIWIDYNQNGIHEASEEILEGVSVHLCNVDGTVVSSTYTDSNGACSFDVIRPGQYFIKFVTGSSLDFTIPFAGATAVDSDVTGANGFGTTNLLNIHSCQISQNIDAGISYRVLPVTWKNIDGVALEKSNLITWQVASQINVRHFKVYKSKTGLQDWVGCGQVSANTSEVESSYEYLDDDIFNPFTYYKVESVDHDGKKQLSPVVFIKRIGFSEMMLAPNPTSEMMTITLQSEDMQYANDMMIQIFAANGSMVIQRPLNAYGQISFSVSGLESGLYQAVLIYHGDTLHSKSFSVVK